MNNSDSHKFIQLSYKLLIIFYLFFIAAASFYLQGKIPSTMQAIDILLAKGSAFSFSFHNLRDVATNILLYLPLGFLVALYRSARAKLKLISVFLLLGTAVSIIVEIIQAFIGRFSDISDIISNTSGYILGYLVAYAALKYFHLSTDTLLGIKPSSDSTALNSIAGLRFIFISITFITCLLPLNVTVSFSEIYSKLNSLDGALPRLILDPLYHLDTDTSNWHYLVLNLMLYIPLAFFSAHIQIKRLHASTLIPALHCLCFSLLIELSNIFIKSGRSDIIIPPLAFTIGAIVASLCIKLYHVSEHRISRDQSLHQLFICSCIFYILFLATLSLSPFEFELSTKAIKYKLLNSSNFIPFKAHFSTRSIASAVDIIKEILLYVPLGALIALCVRTQMKMQGRIIICFLFGCTFSALTEAMQLTVIGRYVDVTDCILGALGCTIGVIILPLFNKIERLAQTDRT